MNPDDFVSPTRQAVEPRVLVMLSLLQERDPPTDNYSAHQLRDADGRFTAGRMRAFVGAKVGEGAYRAYQTVEGGKALTARILAHPVVRAMGAPLRLAAKATAKLYEKIKARYGPRTAKRVFLAGQALSWGAFGAGHAAGVTIWIPAAVATAPFAAIAEVLHQVHHRGHARVANEAEMDEGTVDRMGEWLVGQVQRVCDAVNEGSGPAANAGAWRTNVSSEQVALFVEWLREQLRADVVGVPEQQLWDEYILQGYRRGAGRAFDDAESLKDPALADAIPDEVKSYWTEPLDFYRGTREEFLRSTFGRPASLDKVKLLAGRTFSELNGVTDYMSNLMGRTLADGLVQGKGAREVARDLANAVDIGRKRALTVARTELVRAHAAGQLAAMREMGVEEVGVSVEWSTSGMGTTRKGNPSPCPLCAPMQGVVLTLDEAEGMIPRHPNCMCAFVPAGLGESGRGQLRSKSKIDAAVRSSQRRQYGKRKVPRKPSWSTGKPVAKARPRPMVSPARNQFCATGEGGGVDATCSPGGRSGPRTMTPGVRRAPIDCGADVKLAVRYLAMGHSVRLNQPEQLSTLIGEMHKQVRRAVKLGKDAPHFDLCKVSVRGTNLFCEESKGYPRVNMPQMRGDPTPGTLSDLKPRNEKGRVDIGEDFIEHLRGRGVAVHEKEIRASHLRASQGEIDGAKVARLVHEAEGGKDLRKRPIFVTRDNYVLDGHHHWAAIVGLGAGRDKDLKVPVHVLDMDIGEAVETANAFSRRAGIASQAIR